MCRWICFASVPLFLGMLGAAIVLVPWMQYSYGLFLLVLLVSWMFDELSWLRCTNSHVFLTVHMLNCGIYGGLLALFPSLVLQVSFSLFLIHYFIFLAEFDYGFPMVDVVRSCL